MRRLLSILSALSLLLLVSVCALWVRGYFVCDLFAHSSFKLRPDGYRAGESYLYSQRGVLGIGLLRDAEARPTGRTAVALYDIDVDIHAAKRRAVARSNPWRRVPPNEGWPVSPPPSLLGRLGFVGERFRESATGVHHLRVVAAAPCWSFAAACLPLPSLWLSTRLRGRRRKRGGLCPACGYDLTGNTSGTCPECGTKVTSPPSA